MKTLITFGLGVVAGVALIKFYNGLVKGKTVTTTAPKVTPIEPTVAK